MTVQLNIIQPPTPARIEAEVACTVLADVGSTAITTIDAAQDSGQSIRLPTRATPSGAAPMSRRRAPTGSTARSGDPNNPALYWHPNAYEIRIDNNLVTFNGSTAAFSASDPVISGYFGTLYADVQFTSTGTHQLDIKALAPNLFVDDVDVVSSCVPTNERFELELNFKMSADVGSNPIYVDAYQGRVVLPDPGDAISASFTVGAAGYYRLRLRGKTSDPAERWDLNTDDVKIERRLGGAPRRSDHPGSGVSGHAELRCLAQRWRQQRGDHRLGGLGRPGLPRSARWLRPVATALWGPPPFRLDIRTPFRIECAPHLREGRNV